MLENINKMLHRDIVSLRFLACSALAQVEQSRIP